MTMTSSLPSHARLPINRCNLPAVILGSLTFQQHPAPLMIDGVHQLHAQLFDELAKLDTSAKRSENFMDYMRSAFLLDHPEQAGSATAKKRYRREKADYLRLLRGWFFNPDGLEAAVMKGWVESRFGLIPRNHNGPLRKDDFEPYQAFQHQRSMGLYNSNALDAQLDLLYSFCQVELARQNPDLTHLTLYRGTNRIDDYEVLARDGYHDIQLLLNNLNSFTSQRERADEFGDNIIEAHVPMCKLLYFPGMLPATLQSELEFLVLGGVYRVTLHRY